ncbi:MAG TPA: c-type cytochrome [Chitinophagaceae bacterium]|nr:c-type cytochrome [Chitinophagaceae bacterium]
MNRKILFVFAVAASFLLIKCGSNDQKEEQAGNTDTSTTSPNKDTVVISQGSNSKGIGRFNNVKLTHPLNEDMITKAQPIYNAKCMACHKLTDEKLVGPGWKGITDRRTPEWIMNFITNTQVMLDKDLVAQSDLVTCVVRMPNQDLTDEQAREMLEFMRKNDGKN